MKRANLLVVSILGMGLSGCGGGGGGEDDNSSSQRLQLSTTAITLRAYAAAGVLETPQITGTVTGNPRSIYVTVTATSVGIETVSDPQVSGSSATITVVPRAAFSLQPGTYRDTITVKACRDSSCNNQFAGSPVTVNVTYSVGLEVTPASLTIESIEGAQPPAQTINLSYYAGSGSWTTALTYSSGSGWLTVPGSGDTLPAAVNVSLAPRPAGNYAASLSVTATAPGSVNQTRTIPVNYGVHPLVQVTAVQDFNISNQQGAAGQNREATVSAADTARNTAWTATVDAASPWLQLTNSTGTTGSAGTLQMALAPAEVAKLRNGRYVATVTVDPADANASNVNLAVAINVDRTQIATVAPYVVAANRSAEVILRGTLFDATAIQGIRFGSADALSYHVDGATRIRATYPALPAGRYPVTVVTGGGTVESSAELIVQSAGGYAAAGFGAAPIQFSSMSEFDPERRSCYMASSSQVAAIRAGASSWTSQTSSASFVLIHGLVLTADGRELIVMAGNDIVHLDPVTLAETGRVRVTNTDDFTVGDLARVDDGSVVFIKQSQVWKYIPWTHESQMIAGDNAFRTVKANRTGNKILGVTGGNFDSFILIDSAGTAAIPLFSGPNFYSFSSDRFGNRWAFTRLSSNANTVVTDSQGATIGQVTTFNADDVAMSDDGLKFLFSTPNQYRIFNLSPLASGQTPTLTGTVSVNADLMDHLYLTPYQDEIVSCGKVRVGATAIP